jgi:Spy/CpxP family protein refolding chaperone
MKYQKLFFACLLTLALSLGLTGFAQNNQPLGPRPGMHHNPMEFVLRNLDLSTDQKEKIHSIFIAQQPTIRPILDNDFSNHEKLHELIENGSFDIAQVKAIAENLATNKISLLIEKQRGDSQIYSVLNQEQQTKFDQIKSNLEQHRPIENKENKE